MYVGLLDNVVFCIVLLYFGVVLNAVLFVFFPSLADE